MVLIGPRQVGKTTLAQAVADKRDAAYVDLELPSDRAKISDVEQYCAENADRLVILDEVHRAPGLFAPLRGIIDQRRRAGRRAGFFLLLGSASVELLEQSSETLAGRVALCELNPFGVAEIPAADQRRLWCRGGFPESYLAPGDAESLDWRVAFVRTYLERDIPQLAPRVSRGFHSACEDLRPARKFVVHGGSESYPLAEDIRAMSLPAMVALAAGSR